MLVYPRHTRRQIGRDHGLAASHGFKLHHPEHLSVRDGWKHDTRRRRGNSNQLPIRHLSQKLDPVGESLLLGQIPERAFERTSTDDPKTRLHTFQARVSRTPLPCRRRAAQHRARMASHPEAHRPSCGQSHPAQSGIRECHKVRRDTSSRYLETNLEISMCLGVGTTMQFARR